jgi:predicted 2-oxoglutarate/Fe(II)-dependent dioxygenase YbiX
MLIKIGFGIRLVGNKMHIEKYICSFDNFIEPDALKVFQEVIKSNFLKYHKGKIINNEQGMIDGEVDENTRKTEIYDLNNTIETNRTALHWCNFFHTKFQKAIMDYSHSTKTQSACTLRDIQILKYPVNGFYKTHVDHGLNTPRTLSLIFFPNEDYEGGNLVFQFPDQNLRVSVKQNQLLIWPSTFLYPHKVEPVTKGNKYSVVAWAL